MSRRRASFGSGETRLGRRSTRHHDHGVGGRRSTGGVEERGRGSPRSNQHQKSKQHLLKALNERFTICDASQKLAAYYSPGGAWGLHCAKFNSKVMPGFSPSPPGTEICGNYTILYVAVKINDLVVIRRRMPKKASLTLENSEWFGWNIMKATINLPIKTDARVLQHCGGAERYRCSRDSIGSATGNGFDFDVYPPDSDTAKSCRSKPTNSGLLYGQIDATGFRNETKKIGFIYVVDSRKAFKLVNNEVGSIKNETASFKSQTDETAHAELACKSRHYKFLCHELGLPCSCATLVTSFLPPISPPYIFAEPGDLWLDMKLKPPARTYLLARRVKSSSP